MTDTNKQPYESWKGSTWVGAVSSNSQPSSNGTTSNPNDYQSAFGTARPLKIWRKQLLPPKITYSSLRRVGVEQINNPGGSVLLGDASNCIECAGAGNVASISVNVFGNYSKLTPNTPNNIYSNGVYFTDVSENIFNKCISCDPESNVIKSGVTLLNKKYYTTTSSYLQSRCQTFQQKSTPQQRAGINYVNSQGVPLWPTDSPNGPQVFNTPNCPTNCSPGVSVSTIYKPNNVNYGVQGAVDSSTRLMRLKQQTVNKNGASFASAFGKAAANAGSYSANATSPYFIKSKINICNPAIYHRNGNKTMCFTS